LDRVLFVLGNLFAFFVAASVAHLAFRGREPWRQALATLAGFPVLILAVFFVLGHAGKLSAGATVMLLALVALVLAMQLYRRMGRPADSSSVLTAPQGTAAQKGATEDLLLPLAVALLGAFGGLLAVKSCFLGTDFFIDDLSFHATVPAHWAVGGGFSVVPFNWHGYHPYNAEVLACWFLLPFHSDAFASLAGFYWAALAVTAIVAIHRIQSHATSTAVLCAAVFLSAPAIVSQTQTFSAIDLATIALLLAAIPFAIPSPGALSPVPRWPDAIYCGLLVGFVTGCKVSFAPVAFILFLWWLLSRQSASTRVPRVWNSVIFATCVAATGAHWYVRTFLLTGNPLFPAQIGPFEGPMTPEIAAHTRLLSGLLAAPPDLKQWLSLFEQHLNWPFGLGLLAISGYGATLFWQLRRRGSVDPRAGALRLLLLLVGCTSLLLYPNMPFSGRAFGQEDTLRVSLRYVISPFTVGLVLFFALCEPSRRGRSFWWALAVLAALTAWPGYTGRSHFVVVVTGGIALLGLARSKLIVPFFSSLLRPGVSTVCISLLLVILAVWAPYKQRATDQNIYGYTIKDQPVGAAWRELNTRSDISEGARIAAFGITGPLFWYYPTFGRKLELVPTFVEADGSPSLRLHERWEREKKSLWETEDLDLSQLVTHLEANAVDYVLVSKMGGDVWPPQQAVLASSERAQAIYEDGYSTIWKLTAR